MKTSLTIDDAVYRDAQKEARRTGKTLSETISEWARLGRRLVRQQRNRQRSLRTVDLGKPLLNIDSRADWMEALDEDRTRL
jgi:hypothetical protein